ncbi:putative quinol monooxygenase, partial [Alloalcanivorax venustensis]
KKGITMLGIVAILTAQPGKGDALAAEMSRIAVEVRKEEGNHGYTVHQSVDDGDTVMIYEQYNDQAALDAHRENMKGLGGGLKDLLAGRPDVKLFNVAG